MSKKQCIAKQKFLSLIVIGFLVAASFLTLFAMPLAHAQAGQNWLTGWTNSRSIIINPVSGAGTNYQLRLFVVNGTSEGASTTYATNDTLTLNNKTRSDFGDIRFTTSDGSTLLSYYIETLNSGINATFWVKITDDLSSSPATIYLYYTNPSATSISNGVNTFLFFDNFAQDGGTVNTTLWTKTGNATIINNQLVIDATSATSGISSKSTFATGIDLYVNGRVSVLESACIGLGFDGGLLANIFTSNSVTYLNPNWVIYISGFSSAIVAADNNYHEFQFERNSTYATGWVDQANTTKSQSDLASENITIASNGNNPEYINYLFVTKTVMPNSPSFGNMGAEHQYYFIISSATGSGTISPLGTLGELSGTSQTYIMLPVVSYKVNNVNVDGVSVGAVTSYTFSNIQTNHTIDVSFKAKPEAGIFASGFTAIGIFTIIPIISAVLLIVGLVLGFLFVSKEGNQIEPTMVFGAIVTIVVVEVLIIVVCMILGSYQTAINNMS